LIEKEEKIEQCFVFVIGMNSQSVSIRRRAISWVIVDILTERNPGMGRVR
jgi:hypothetical protein